MLLWLNLQPQVFTMKKWLQIFLLCFGWLLLGYHADAQCSICTKTAMQQGEKPASGLNSGIVYLMLTPFAVIGVISYRWWKNEKLVAREAADQQ